MSKNSKQVATSEPWREIRPYLLDAAQQGANLAANGGFVPLPRMGEQTRGALTRMGQMARNNPYLRDATQGLTNFSNANTSTGPVNFAAMNAMPSGGGVSQGGKMSNSAPGSSGGASSGGKMSNGSGGGVSSGGKGSSMASQIRALQQGGPSGLADSMLPDGSVAPAQFENTGAYAGINAMRDAISARVLPQVAGMFGQGGFANSTMAQQTAADALGNALAGFEYDQFNQNRVRDDSNIRFNTDLLTQQQARSDQNAMFNQSVAAADINRGLARDTSAIQMAPQLSAMRYNDIAALGQVGAQRDAFRAARDRNPADNVLEQANFFASLGGLGGVQSGTQAPGALQALGGLGQFGANAALAYGALGGGLGAGAGGAFGAGSIAASPALAGSIGGISSLLPALPFCDRRLKRDIERTPLTFKGLALYTFRYFFDAPDVRRIGPMADEAPKRARIVLPSGYLAVDMGAL